MGFNIFLDELTVHRSCWQLENEIQEAWAKVISSLAVLWFVVKLIMWFLQAERQLGVVSTLQQQSQVHLREHHEKEESFKQKIRGLHHNCSPT